MTDDCSAKENGARDGHAASPEPPHNDMPEPAGNMPEPAGDMPEPATGSEPITDSNFRTSPNQIAEKPAIDLPQLVAEHASALYRYAFRLTGTSADAEDLTQQTFLIAHRKIEQLRDLRSARVWLMTVMRRTYCRSQNRGRVERELTVPLDADSLPADEVSQDWQIDRELLQAAIDELPDDYKLVLLSFYFENLSYRDMAEQFGLPIGTVMSRLSRAKSHLRQRLFEAELQPAADAGPIAPRRGGT
ncbi:MAG TPA: sigma-70 family RNA polymerase sigma factor [Pirellulales bacterium]|jgi:RNA polymerase sigma-70 factor (ECF subfamily)|nr:sigma-70 family RNA polymerase sigma factor [Pirellulales bacterium]